MSVIRSLDELKRLKDKAIARRETTAAARRAEVTIGMGACGVAAGAKGTMQAILELIEEEDLDGIIVRQTGCIGLCEWEPIVEVVVGSGPRVTYGKVSPERAKQIIREHVVAGKKVPDRTIPDWLLVRRAV